MILAFTIGTPSPPGGEELICEKCLRTETVPPVAGLSLQHYIYDIGTHPKSASVESCLRKNLTFRLTN
jgi:hypothetical protein